VNCALYFGRVWHRRSGGVEHAFNYRHFLLCLDLAELPGLFAGRWLWSHEAPNLVSLRRADYLGDSAQELSDAVRERVREELGRAPAGRICLLTQPRFLGYVFNPVSFYYCFDAAGALDAIVAEITNTPWNERHSYVLDARGAAGAQARFQKRFHVSPFQDMGQEYAWSFGPLGERLDVRMQNFAAGRECFEARLALQRRALDGAGLARALLAFPGFSARSIAAIYWQALRLKLKGAPFFEHPRTRAPLQDLPSR
jgi:hypothetical protein